MKNAKWKFVMLNVGLSILFAGCGIFSLHPLYHENDLVFRQELVGHWQSASDTKSRLTIARGKEKDKYLFLLVDGEDSVIFDMGLLQLHGQYFVDLYPSNDCDVFGDGECYSYEMLVRNYVPVHSFMKIDVGEGQITLTEFDDDRLQKLFKQNRIRLPHETIDDDYLVITASTDELQKFIGRYANDDEAFTEPSVYHELP